MLSREDILDEYNIDEDGYVTSSCKFEGEMLYAPMLWELCMDGHASEEDEDGNFFIETTEEMREEFEEIPEEVHSFKLFETEEGFVICNQENVDDDEAEEEEDFREYGHISKYNELDEDFDLDDINPDEEY